MIRQVFHRYRGSLGQLLRFSIVGASGVLVNLLVAYGAKKIAPHIWASAQEGNIWLPIPGTPYNIRWFLVFSMIAFVVANVSNYQLNRVWSFKSDHHAGWFAEFLPFFTVGLLAQCLGMILEQALMHPNSPIGLPSSIFDNSTGLRTKWYWAHLIMICVTIPVSFLLNKFWTFRAIRRAPHGSANQGG
ncbi:MAG: GtrA family protein [Propionibacteriaceae bacterium]|nr:GtrA family protein [Propionibacteriaceae bacterium]